MLNVKGPPSGSCPDRVTSTGVFILVVMDLESAVGGWLVPGGVVESDPNTAISVMLAQLFSLFPFTVILTYLPSVPAGILYFCKDEVVPLLFVESLFTKLVVASSDVDITKSFCLPTLPRYHAISTLHMLFFDPRSS